MPNTHAFVPSVRILPWNDRGRDFVIGDLHGCFSDLQLAMRRVRFDVNVDRLLSVGDLTDRGPDSWGALSLLEEPWFFAVKGNHEDLLIDHIKGRAGSKYASSDFFANGGGWWYRNVPAGFDKARLLAMLERLPHVLVVFDEASGRRFHVVHGELVAFHRGNVVLLDNDDIDYWSAGREGSVPVREFDLIWERTIFSGSGARFAPTNTRLSPTFCGHTIVKEITCRSSHINLDTGAFKPWVYRDDPTCGSLSMVEAATFVPAL